MKGLFPDYRDKTLDEFQILDPTHESAVHQVKGYMEDLSEVRGFGLGLTLQGPEGVGKTYLAEMVLKYAQEKGFSVESIEADNFVNLHMRQISQSKAEDYEEAAKLERQIERILFKIDFVLFDDIGREHIGGTQWAAHLLFNAVRTRSNRRRPCLFTTNLTLPKLEKLYTVSFTSVLQDKTNIIEIEGADFRCRTAS